MTLTARGSGGSFDGLELKETLTRAGGPEFDPALRYEMTGRTAPVDGWGQTIFADDFEDGVVDPAWRPTAEVEGTPADAPRLEERNGRMTLHLNSTSEAEVPSLTAIVAVGRTVVLRDGQTLELRLDLAGTTGMTSQPRGGKRQKGQT